MGYVITNGLHYCKVGNIESRIQKTTSKKEAYMFGYKHEAWGLIFSVPSKLKEYYVIDSVTGKRIPCKTKYKRIHFPEKTRGKIYRQAGGRCELCGRKILYSDMTVDHIIPIAMGGTNDMKNLQCACSACNSLKGSILPDSFYDRITSIFMYQMEKQYADKLSWKLVKRILKLKYSL